MGRRLGLGGGREAHGRPADCHAKSGVLGTQAWQVKRTQKSQWRGSCRQDLGKSERQEDDSRLCTYKQLNCKYILSQ